MKKKILSTLLVCVLSMNVLVGCGGKADDAVSAVGEGEGKLASEVNDKVEEVVQDDEATKIDWGKTDETKTESADVEYTLEDVQAAFPADGFTVTAETEGFEMSVGSVGGNAIVTLDYAIGDVVYSFDMYTIGSTDAYSILSDGTTTTYSHAPIAEGEDATSATGFESMVPNFDNVTNVTYVETKEYNGGTYDVVKVETTEGEGDFAVVTYSDYYINVETQMCDYMISIDEASGSEVVATITVIDEIVLPEAFQTAEVEEITAEDLAGQMLAIMFLPMSDEVETEGGEAVEDVTTEDAIESDETVDEFDKKAVDSERNDSENQKN